MQKKKQLIIKHENQNFQPRLWPSSVVINYIIYNYIFIYIYMKNSESVQILNTDEGSLLPKNRDCTKSNDIELYLMCCGVMLQ